MGCAQCGFASPEHAKFCVKCGASLSLACATCGTRLPAGAKFCLECGHAVNATPIVEPRAPPPRAYTPKHLAERILISRAALEGERKQVAVLFAHLANFTQVSERLDPEGLHGLMDLAFEIILAEVHRYEGTVHQFAGDGIMAFFGAPLTLQDHAVRAVEAALAMQAAMTRAGLEFERRWGKSPTLSIGINTGLVVVGEIGDDLRMDYTAQGDTVNTAARLQHIAEPGTVALSEATYREIAHQVECVTLGRHHVEGKALPLEVFRPTAKKVRSSRTTGVSEAPLAPFVGRGAELKALLGGLERARGGHGAVVIVRGEAGIGKSRLIGVLWRQIPAGTVRWAEGHAVVASGLRTPYLPISALLRTLVSLPDDNVEARATLDVRLEDLALDARAIGPPLRYLLGLGPPDDEIEGMPAPERKRAIFEALSAVVEAASARIPHILVIENGQWLDEGSEEFLDFFAERVGRHAVLLVLTCRPDDQRPRLASHPGALRLDVVPLDSAERDALARAIVGERIGGALLALVVEKTGGNPLFIEEVVRSMVEVPESEARSVLATLRRSGMVRIPSTVRGILATRIDHLPEHAKGVLGVASVVGREFSARLLNRITDRPDGVAEALAMLVKDDIITRTAWDTFAFRCPLMQEVAYDGLLIQRCRTLHGQIGRAIEEDDPSRAAERAEELAHHFLQAEDWERSAGYLREAARKAAALCSNGDAVRLLGRALDALKRLPDRKDLTGLAIDIRLDLRPPLMQLGRLKEVLALSQEAERLAREIGDEPRRGRVYTYLVNYHYMQGEPAQTIAYGERCLSIGEKSGDAGLETLARQYIGQSYHAQGRYDEACAIFAPNATPTAPAGLPRVASSAWLAFALAERGEFAHAHEHGEAAEQAGAELGNPYGLAIARTMRAMVWLRQGRLEAAVHLLQPVLDACREKRLIVWQPIPSVLLGAAMVYLERVDEGLPLLEAGVALTERLGVRAYLALWMTHLAEGVLAAGQIDRAGELGERALWLARDCKEVGHQAWAWRLLGEVAAARGPGAMEDAETAFAEAMALATAFGMRPLLARCHLGLGAACRQRGLHVRASGEFDAATRLFASMGSAFWPDPPSDTTRSGTDAPDDVEGIA